ncbi:MAG TPA: PD-(D/E)XK nuclease family protein [Acidimicrobiales bacterium]|nr:PD-(D/E)XK nuclease family protein [Acidimicrobiales bacterium]
MSLELPSALSPSKVASFTHCGLAFRFSSIDRIYEPPSIHMTKGTIVHRCLERLFYDFGDGGRTRAVALAQIPLVRAEYSAHPEYVELCLDAASEQLFWDDVETLVLNLFRLEDPNAVKVLGTELRLEADLGGVIVRGVIDRLELASDGALVVTDYKTGAAPKVQYEGKRLAGVHFYAAMCEATIGRRPDRIQLLHLREPEAIVTIPTDQSVRGLKLRTGAIWKAIETACARDDFRPNPGPLCGWCSFQEWCPVFGGDPVAAPRRTRDADPAFQHHDVALIA